MYPLLTLKHSALTLSTLCLSFDFIGTNPEESGEDISTVQVPTAWRPAIQDVSTMQLFFDFYQNTRPPQSDLALKSLVQVSISIRFKGLYLYIVVISVSFEWCIGNPLSSSITPYSNTSIAHNHNTNLTFTLQSPLHIHLNSCVQLSSVRRSLFSSDTERTAFLHALMAGTFQIMDTQAGLDEDENYHEYCR